MKKLSFLALVAASMLLGACSESENVAQEPEQVWNKEGKGYMALNIQLPTTPVTRAANDVYDDGVAAEYVVNDAILVLFTGGSAADGSDATYQGAYALTLPAPVADVDNDNITSSYLATAAVEGEITGNVWALVLINTDNVYDNSSKTFAGTGLTLGTGKTIKDVQAAVTSANFNKISSDKGIFMTNAVLSTAAGGYKTTAGAPAKSNLRILAQLDGSKIFATADQAKLAGNEAGSIFVERALAKATLSAVPSKVELSGGDLTISSVQWALNNVETTSFVVRNMFDEDGDKTDEIADYMGYSSAAFGNPNYYYRFAGNVKVGETVIQPTVDLYRSYWCVDPHYTSNLVAPNTTLTAATYANWKDGEDKLIPQYCNENTFNVEHQSHNNTTRAVFKVTLENTADFYTINGANEVSTIADAKAAIINQLVIMTNVKKAFSNNGYSGTIKSTCFDITLTTTAGACTAVTNSLQCTNWDLDGDSTPDITVDADKTAINTALAACTSEVTTANANVDIQLYRGGVMYYEAQIRHFADPSSPGYSDGTFGSTATDLAPWNKWETGENKPAAGSSTSDAYKGSTNVEKDQKYLGRYGMVRNNWYDLSISKIEHLGSPTDVSTTVSGDPDDKIDPDKKYIAVKINVLSWAKRTQSWSF